jgi:hypothetical protein
MVLGCALLYPTYGDSIALPMPTVAANLLADLENSVLSIYQPFLQSHDFSIRQFGVPETTFSKPSIPDDRFTQIYVHETGLINSGGWATELPEKFLESGISQIGTSEISPNEYATFKDGIFQIGTTEIAVIKSASSEGHILNLSTAQVSLEEREIIQLGSSQINITQVGTTKINLNQAAVTQLGMTEIGVSEQSLLQLNLGQVNTSQIQLREIQPSTPTIIQIQQFLTVHNLNLQNTTIPTWTEFLTGTTPFNLNIEITALSTGQFAVRAALLNFHRAVKEGRYQLE